MIFSFFIKLELCSVNVQSAVRILMTRWECLPWKATLRYVTETRWATSVLNARLKFVRRDGVGGGFSSGIWRWRSIAFGFCRYSLSRSSPWLWFWRFLCYRKFFDLQKKRLGMNRVFFSSGGRTWTLRPSGYEPDELPTAPPRVEVCPYIVKFGVFVKSKWRKQQEKGIF